MARVITKKQRDFVEEYVKTGNGAKSALKTYDTDDYKTAQSIATENLSKPVVVMSIQERLEAGGIGDSVLVREHKKILLQDKDLSNKTKGIELAYKLKGYLKEAIGGGNTYNTQINLLSVEERRARIKELEAKLLNK